MEYRTIHPPPPPPPTKSPAISHAPPVTPSQTNLNSANVQEDPSKRRNFVIAEIISTEKTYYEKLEAIIEVFVNPLVAMKILNDEDQALQFNGLRSIYQIHKEMYYRMRSDSEKDILNMGDLFSQFSSRLQSYKEYLVNFEEAITRRGVLLTKNKKFAEFIETAKQNPQCSGHDVESLLISPVQRIPRCRLLLEDLLKYTPPGHSEHVAGNILLTY